MTETTQGKLLHRAGQLTATRDRLLAKAAEIDEQRHAAIVAALDSGATLTAAAQAVGVSRQALTRYIARRTNIHA